MPPCCFPLARPSAPLPTHTRPINNSALLQKLPPGHYHASSKVVAVDLTHPTAALIELESGERVAGNLIVAADG
jgi:hypothetical protein